MMITNTPQPLFAGRARNLAIAAALLLPGAGLVAGCGGDDKPVAQPGQDFRVELASAAGVNEALDVFEASGVEDQVAAVEACPPEPDVSDCFTFRLKDGSEGKVSRRVTRSDIGVTGEEALVEIYPERSTPAANLEPTTLLASFVPYGGDGDPQLGLALVQQSETGIDSLALEMNGVYPDSVRKAEQRMGETINNLLGAVKSKA